MRLPGVDKEQFSERKWRTHKAATYAAHKGHESYTAWQPWNGTTLAAVAWPEAKPSNGSAIGNRSFFEELFAYTEDVGSELDLDALDVMEVSTQNTETTQRLYAQIRSYVLTESA